MPGACAWKAACWARLGDATKAMDNIYYRESREVGFSESLLRAMFLFSTIMLWYSAAT